MNLGETVAYCGLKGCSYVGISLCRLCVPSVSDGGAGFDVDASHVFPQGVLAAITLVGVGLELEELEQAPGVRQDFLSGQWPSPPYWVSGPIPRYWSGNPEGQA